MKSRVLITREADRAAELIRLLRAEGIEAVAEPVTRTVYLPHDEDLPAMESFDWLVFTSANGVKGFDQARKSALLPAALRTAVVGPGTADEATRLLRQPDYIAKQNDAASLAGELLEEDPELPHRAILWPCAAKSSLDLAMRLKDAGANVVPWPVYYTEAVPQQQLFERLAALWPWDAAVFAAPSAVAAFVNAWPQPWDFHCVAIGHVTAKALTKAGVEGVQVSRSPEAADLCEAILKPLRLR
jgi:uroporphyrinogen-III synthase